MTTAAAADISRQNIIYDELRRAIRRFIFVWRECAGEWLRIDRAGLALWTPIAIGVGVSIDGENIHIKTVAKTRGQRPCATLVLTH